MESGYTQTLDRLPLWVSLSLWKGPYFRDLVPIWTFLTHRVPLVSGHCIITNRVPIYRLAVPQKLWWQCTAQNFLAGAGKLVVTTWYNLSSMKKIQGLDLTPNFSRSFLSWMGPGCVTCCPERLESLWPVGGKVRFSANIAASSLFYLSGCKQPVSLPGLNTWGYREAAGRRRDLMLQEERSRRGGQHLLCCLCGKGNSHFDETFT